MEDEHKMSKKDVEAALAKITPKPPVHLYRRFTQTVGKEVLTDAAHKSRVRLYRNKKNADQKNDPSDSIGEK